MEPKQIFQTLFDEAIVGMANCDPYSGRILSANARLAKITGYSAEELQTFNISDITHPEDRQRDFDHLREMINGNIAGYSIEKRYIRKDGTIAWVALNVAPFRDSSGKVIETAAMMVDITARKQAEVALAVQLDFTTSLINSLQDGVVVCSQDGTILDVNPIFCEMTGFSREEYVGHKPPFICWPTEEFAHIQSALTASLSGQFQETEFIFMRKNGERFPVIGNPSAVKNSKGEIAGYVCTMKDITERKRVERELFESRGLLRNIIDSTPSNIFAFDLQKRFTLLNDKMAQSFGISKEEGLGKTVFDLTPKEIADQLDAINRGVMATGESVYMEEVVTSTRLHENIGINCDRAGGTVCPCPTNERHPSR